jgi:RNA polymerase sigma-70 factor (family 1)
MGVVGVYGMMAVIVWKELGTFAGYSTCVQYSDNDLVVALRAGEEKVFEDVFRSFYPALCRYAESIVKDDAQAEDIVQQVFVTIWEKRMSISFQLSAKAYLYRAVHNRCLNYLEQGKVRQLYRNESVGKEEPLSAAADAGGERRELQERISRAIEKLPEQCRLIFRLSRFDEMKYAEIAAHLNISVKTVENQMGKALRILREELKEYLPLLLLFISYIQSLHS